MRVLLDENLDTDLRYFFPEKVQAETVEYRGWKGIGSGELVGRAEQEYDVLVTRDRGIPDEQYIRQLNLVVIVLRPVSQNFDDLKALMPQVAKLLDTVKPGHIAEVYPPDGE